MSPDKTNQSINLHTSVSGCLLTAVPPPSILITLFQETGNGRGLLIATQERGANADRRLMPEAWQQCGQGDL